MARKTDSDYLRLVLERAAGFVRKGWTQYKPARDRYDNPVSFDSRRAVKWCPLGAIERAAQQLPLVGGRKWSLRRQAVEALKGVIRAGDGVAAWNDMPQRNRSQVVRALARARSRVPAESRA